MRIVGLFTVFVVVVGCNLFADPFGPRDCECELMDEWAAQLPITPDGDTVGIANVDTGEGANGFGVGGSRDEPDGFDRQVVEDTLTDVGFNMRVDLDQEDSWNAEFFPGETQGQSPWSISITQTGGEVGFQVSVGVDGSPWGLETIEDLWDSYQRDYDAALQAQVERQEEAIDKLQVLEAAMRTMVVNQP